MASYPQADTPELPRRSRIARRAEMPVAATHPPAGNGQSSSLPPTTRATAAPSCQTPTHNQEGR
jgi:hypothetical protein